MTDTFTASLGLTKQQTGTNDEVWGDIHNDGFIGLCDDAIAGRTAIDVTAGNVQLTSTPGAPDQARAMMVIVTAGTPGAARDVILPTKEKMYIVHNGVGDGSVVTFKTALGPGVAVADGTRTQLFVDQAADVVREVGLASGGGGSTVAPMAAPIITASTVIDNNGTGSFAPNVLSNQQGNIGVVFLPAFTGTTFDVTVNSTLFRIEPNVGSFPIVPLIRDVSQALNIQENTVETECYAVLYADGSAIEFFRADGALWTFGSTRRIDTAAQHLLFGLTGL